MLQIFALAGAFAASEVFQMTIQGMGVVTWPRAYARSISPCADLLQCRNSRSGTTGQDCDCLRSVALCSALAASAELKAVGYANH
jgi:hypothetical protein